MVDPAQVVLSSSPAAAPACGHVGRLFLKTLVPTDRRTAAGRAAFSVALELTPGAGPGNLLPRVMSSLLFTLNEEVVGVIAEVTPSADDRPRSLFATEDPESLCWIIAQHWCQDRRVVFHVLPMKAYRRAVSALCEGARVEPSLVLMRVVQNRNRSGLIVRGSALNAVRAREQVRRLCVQQGLELVL
ncbi:MAG: hypothetical protein ACM3ZA_05440 [Bacillota bacterium]